MIAKLLLALALPVPWITAGWYAGGLPGTPTARLLRRRAGYVLLAVGLAGIGAFAAAGWWLASSPAAVFALALPGALAVGLALPRLIRLRDRARPFAAAGPATPAPLALRAAAAHPMLATPLQVTAYGASVALVVGLGVIGATPTLLGAIAVSGVTWLGHRSRHRRMAGTVLVRPPSVVGAVSGTTPWHRHALGERRAARRLPAR